MSHKIPGCCSRCDEPAFEVMSRWDIGEKRFGEPKRLGKPLNGTIRVSFLLLAGSCGDFTFCASCAEALSQDDYTTLWRKNLAGWLREQDGDPEKFKNEFANGLLCELGRVPWSELNGS